jgi:hypothetical protein
MIYQKTVRQIIILIINMHPDRASSIKRLNDNYLRTSNPRNTADQI